jgi:hypothetical protein
MERRYSRVEVRAETAPDGRPSLVGHAAVFNRISKPIPTKNGSFREKLHPKVFDRALRSSAYHTVVANVEHDNNRILGTTRAGSLELKTDNVGLHVRCYPDLRVSYCADAYHQVQNGNIRSMSFAFALPEDDDDSEDWEDAEENGERFALRTVNDCNLYDVSFVNNGAYDAAWCDSRALFPSGCPAGLEARSAGGVIIPSRSQVSESEERRLRMRRLRNSL